VILKAIRLTLKILIDSLIVL